MKNNGFKLLQKDNVKNYKNKKYNFIFSLLTF